jgi:rhodanese-related sulfurtransferase
MYSITSEEFLRKQEDFDGLLDVREIHEYQDWHMLDAQHLPLSQIASHPLLHELDPAGKYALYCRSGGRSTIAAEQLERHGFTDVTTIVGPIEVLFEAES